MNAAIATFLGIVGGVAGLSAIICAFSAADASVFGSRRNIRPRLILASLLTVGSAALIAACVYFATVPA